MSEEIKAPEAPALPTAEQVLQGKIQEASEKINSYLEAAGLEMRVIHTISLVPKPAPKI